MKQIVYLIIPVWLSIFIVMDICYAQQARQQSNEGEVLMLEEIRIQVTPELPTVVVTIPRQKPELKSVTMEKNIETLLGVDAYKVKPRLADMTVSKVEDLQKILAKERNR